MSIEAADVRNVLRVVDSVVASTIKVGDKEPLMRIASVKKARYV